MIEITRDNYELFAVDYIEGDLAMDTLIKFEVFLSNNPDIEEELKSLPEFDLQLKDTLSDSEILSLKKGAMLSKDINEDNCDFYFAAYHEGDLSSSEKESVDHFLLAFPIKKDDFMQVGLLHFNADKNLSFPLKSSIKKTVPLGTFQVLGRVAAVFILLLSIALVILLPKKEKQKYTQRNSIIEFPKEKEQNSEFQLKEKTEKKNRIVKLTKSQSKKQTTPEVIVEENIVIVEAPVEIDQEEIVIAKINEKDIPEELASQNSSPNSKTTATEVEDIDSYENNDVIADAAPEKSDRNILTIKRPFKNQKNEEELLASVDSETVIKLSNPLKNIRNKSIRIGPFRVKR